MKMFRFVSLLLICASPLALGMDYPAKPVRVITGTAGNFNDVVSRYLATHLSARWNQPVVVENRAGAGLTIGTAAAAQAMPDGYTLLVSDRTALSTAPTLNKALPYDVSRDLAPITLLARTPMLLVAHPSVPATSLSEFVAYLRQLPQPMPFASAGPATVPHLATEHFKHLTGSNLLPVQYKASPASMMGLLAGETQAGFMLLPIALPHAKAGKVKAYAITTASRFAGVPDVPTVLEAGMPELESQYWLAMLAPAHTPEPVIRKIHRDVVQILDTAGAREMLGAQGAEVSVGTPEELASFIGSETAKWKRVIDVSGLRLD